MTHRNTTGFTLVELMLSMTFISILLLAIAMLVLQISSIYNKGLTLRAVNEAGQLVSSDIQRTLNTNNPSMVTRAPADSAINPTGGRLCVSTTVYAWNYGKYIGTSGVLNTYADGRRDPVRLVKFVNNAADYCKINTNGAYPPLPSATTDLLSAGDSNLAVHKLEISDSSVAGDASQRIYTVNLQLGTNDTSAIDANGCKAPVTQVDDEYCAVNDFFFTARAGNK